MSDTTKKTLTRVMASHENMRVEVEYQVGSSSFELSIFCHQRLAMVEDLNDDQLVELVDFFNMALEHRKLDHAN